MENLAQISFLCRRGLKELDLIFQSYLENHFHSASEQELKQLIILLQMDDQSLLDIIINTPKEVLELPQQQQQQQQQLILQELCEKLRNR